MSLDLEDFPFDDYLLKSYVTLISQIVIYFVGKHDGLALKKIDPESDNFVIYWVRVKESFDQSVTIDAEVLDAIHQIKKDTKTVLEFYGNLGVNIDQMPDFVVRISGLL